MAKYVHEIVNPELFSVSPADFVSNVLVGILAMRITAVPVLSDDRRPVGVVSLRDLWDHDEDDAVGDRMSQPVHVVSKDAEISEAGRLMAELDVHHLVSVDEEGRAVGVVSSLDVVRAVLGLPVRHPDTFPHVDRDGLAWTNLTILDLDHAAVAPDCPGLLVLIHSEAGRPELPVWAEAADNLQARVKEMLSVPQTATPDLARLVELELPHLRFRAAPVVDSAKRARGLQVAREQVTRATGRTLPEVRPEVSPE